MKIPLKVRKWRRRQKEGAIMKPSTFEEIKRKAAAGGATNPADVAGAAYWNTVRKMYRNRRKRVA
jgi:hypothetical protein